MTKRLLILALLVSGIVACSPDKQADSSTEKKASQPATAAAVVSSEDDAELRAKLSEALDGIEADDLRASPIPGIYEISKGASIGYLSADGRYLIEGDLLDLETETNLSDERRNGWRQAKVASIPEDKMIIFAPEKYDHTITVFTDVDCGYCRKLHNEIDTYLKEGIRVRYVFYPLRGAKAASFKKAEAVWCSKDRQAAMTLAKQGKEVKAEACETPVAMHLTTGMELGIRGTPGIITETGEMMPGYMPAKALRAALDGPQEETEEDAEPEEAKAG